ncbi:hypothetical protein GQ42DRAFT_161053 [Ramicandelaber brevisporus]|nr:hypothetical protein GQ42DRAFT_161053 [Ramicandelaber brevisporus]
MFANRRYARTISTSRRPGLDLDNLTPSVTRTPVIDGYAPQSQSNPLCYMVPTHLTANAQFQKMKNSFTIPTPQEYAKPLFPNCDGGIYGLLSAGSDGKLNFVAIERGAIGTPGQIAGLVMSSCGLDTLPDDATDRKWLPLTVLDVILQCVNQRRHTTFPSLFPDGFVKMTDAKGFPILHPELDYQCVPYAVDPGELMFGKAVSMWAPVAGICDLHLAVMDHLWFHWLTHKMVTPEQRRWLYESKNYLLHRSVVTVSRTQVQRDSGAAELAVIHQVAADVEHDGLVELRRVWYNAECDALRQTKYDVMARVSAIINLLKDEETPLFDFLELIIPWLSFNWSLDRDMTYISDSDILAIGKEIHSIKYEVWLGRVHNYLNRRASIKRTADEMEANVNMDPYDPVLAQLRGTVHHLVTIIIRYANILDFFPAERASRQLYPITSISEQKTALGLDQIANIRTHSDFGAAWAARKATSREFGPVLAADDHYYGLRQATGRVIVKHIMSHHDVNTKLMLIVGSWASDNPHQFKDIVSSYAPTTSVNEFRTSITCAVTGRITMASCEVPEKKYKFHGREWDGRVSELYGFSNQAAMRARVRYVPGGGSVDRDINGGTGIAIQSLHVSAMTGVGWMQNLETMEAEQYYHPRYQRHPTQAAPRKRSHGYHMHQVKLREEARWRRFNRSADERERLRLQVLDDSVEIAHSLARARHLMARANESLRDALIVCAAARPVHRWRDVRHAAQQIVSCQRDIRTLNARHEHNVKRYMFLRGHVLGDTAIRRHMEYKERQRQEQEAAQQAAQQAVQQTVQQTQQLDAMVSDS